MTDNTEDPRTDGPLPLPDPARTEPRGWEYPIGGALPPLIGADEVASMRALSTAGIGFVEYLDAWVDKGIADGTLTIAKGTRYREAIARRCVELGEVPHRQEHIARLDLKPGDVLAVIAPADNRYLIKQMGEATKQFLKYVGVDGVEVIVFPPGTELRVLDRQPSVEQPEEPSVHIQIHGSATDDSAATTARVRAVLAEETRRSALYGRGPL